jgi:hypothetical protein
MCVAIRTGPALLGPVFPSGCLPQSATCRENRVLASDTSTNEDINGGQLEMIS